MSATATDSAPPHRIGMIGGDGQMGRLFRALFEADGHPVEVSGPSEDPSYGGLLTRCDVVLVTVPIAETDAVLARIAPLLRPDQLLTDFTSVKAKPVAAMLHSPASVIGCHPLFGPMPDPSGQNVVLCPERPGAYLDWYEGFFRRHGMKVVHLRPEEHDEAMAFIQGLTHFINITFGRTLQTRKANLEHILSACSPVYRVFFAILCRILSGDAQLYGQIQVSNPNNAPVLQEFVNNSSALLARVKDGDSAEVYRLFDESAEYLGDFLQVAREESDFLIQQMTGYLTERTKPGGTGPADTDPESSKPGGAGAGRG